MPALCLIMPKEKEQQLRTECCRSARAAFTVIGNRSKCTADDRTLGILLF